MEIFKKNFSQTLKFFLELIFYLKHMVYVFCHVCLIILIDKESLYEIYYNEQKKVKDKSTISKCVQKNGWVFDRKI